MNFRKMLEKYKQQRIDIDKIVPTQMLGIFYLKLHLLKSVAKPNCERLLELVEQTMTKYVQLCFKIESEVYFMTNVSVGRGNIW